MLSAGFFVPAVKEGADNIVRTRLEPHAEFGVRLAIELEIQAVICALHCRERAAVFGTGPQDVHRGGHPQVGGEGQSVRGKH